MEALIAGNFPASQNILKKTKGKPKERGEVIEKPKYKIIQNFLPVKIFDKNKRKAKGKEGSYWKGKI